MATPHPSETLVGERAVLRLATVDDSATLVGIVNSPGVVEWWTPETLDEMRDALSAPDEGFACYVVELDGAPVGLVQYQEELDEQYRHAGLDIVLVAEVHGRGLGAEVVRTLAAHLIDDRGHHRLTIDPAAHNARAIACYSKVGFRPVGVMRRYERGVDGTFHDGLLMDLLADELVRRGAAGRGGDGGS